MEALIPSRNVPIVAVKQAGKNESQALGILPRARTCEAVREDLAWRVKEPGSMEHTMGSGSGPDPGVAAWNGNATALPELIHHTRSSLSTRQIRASHNNATATQLALRIIITTPHINELLNNYNI